MKNINLFIDKKYEKLNESLCKSIIKKILTHYNYTSYDVNIIFTSDIYLSDLKKKFFYKDQWTDVIAFPLHIDSKFIEGEIYISVPTAKKNASSFKDRLLFEINKFEKGSRIIAEHISTNHQNNNIVSIVAGGDTASCILKFGLEKNFTHVSTGGGASLQLLSGVNLQILESWSKYEE